MSGTKSIAGSTAIAPAAPVADAPSLTLDATTEVATPTMNLNFTTALTSFPKTIGRYNISTHDTLGVVFDRTATRKKRVKKTINTDKFSMALTANNAASGTIGDLVTFGNFTLAANTTTSGEHTIATNFDGTTSNVYVNGVLVTQTTPSITLGAKLLTLGQNYAGRIKDFKFWNYLTVSPTITLSGANPQSVTGDYSELGASAVDSNGNSVNVVIDASTVDDSTTGTYYVTYTATDTNSVTSSVKRQVNVLPQVTQTFSYTGDVQTWTAPADMTVQVQMKGGEGGRWSFGGGGAAGWITFDIDVVSGREYNVVLANHGNGPSGGESGRGGSGGGASGFGYDGTWYAIAGGGGGRCDGASNPHVAPGGNPTSWNGGGPNAGTTTAAGGNASGHNGGNGGNGTYSGGYGVGTGGGGSSGSSVGGGGGGWFGGGGGSSGGGGGSTYYDSNYINASTIVSTQPSDRFKITNVNKLT